MILVHFAQVTFKKMYIFANIFPVLKRSELFISIFGIDPGSCDRDPILE